MSMAVFARKERTDPRARLHSEGTYAFFDRVGTSYFQQVRETINSWVNEAEESERPALLRALQSEDDRTWAAAYFELYLETLFRRLGYSIERHPKLPGSLRSPDFLLTRADGFGCYVEARVASDSDAVTAAAKRRSRVYDSINERVTSAEFYLQVSFEEEGTSDPPVGSLVSGITAWLCGLDWESVSADFTNQRTEHLPVFRWTEQDWVVVIRPVPKGREHRGATDDPVIGVYSGTAGFVDDARPLNRAISKKAGRYGDLRVPFVIAVQATGIVTDDIDIANALYGSEVVRFRSPTEYHLDRKPDGAWLGPHGAQNTRVSGALIARRLTPWTPGTANLSLWPHPAPRHEIEDFDGPWHRHVPTSEGRLEVIRARTAPHEPLELGDPWPTGESGLV